MGHQEMEFEITLRLEDGYRLAADPGVEGVSPITVDEPPPVGGGQGPNPARLLGIAVAGCLTESLLFCLRKARVEVEDLEARARVRLERNERNRLRIAGIEVELQPEFPTADSARIARCEDLFEDYCLVTESVRRGVPVDVRVRSSALESASA